MSHTNLFQVFSSFVQRCLGGTTMCLKSYPALQTKMSCRYCTVVTVSSVEEDAISICPPLTHESCRGV